MTELRFPGQAPSQVARHFLELLDDVYRIHGLFLEEITTLRARIVELEAGKELGEGAFPRVPDVPGCAVYLVSKDGIIQSWSGGACELYGYCVEEVIGRCPDMLRLEVDLSTAARAPFLQTGHRLKKDGQAFEVYLHQAVLRDQAGQICGRMHVEIPLDSHGAASFSPMGSAL